MRSPSPQPWLAAVLAAVVFSSMAQAIGPPTAPPAAQAPAAFTDDDVQKAIEQGRDWLLKQRNADGSFTQDRRWRGCYTALALMTLAYMGEHPNRDIMGKGLDYLLALNPDKDFGGREGYAVPIRVMTLAYVHHKLMADKQALIRRFMADDLQRLFRGQGTTGGWRYQLNGSDHDYSATQWPILAMYEAHRVGVEFPLASLVAAKKYYFRGQKPDGGWPYRAGMTTNSYGSMTGAGVASLFIISDLTEPASGCPCKRGQSPPANLETERRLDAGLKWLADNFHVAKHPAWDWKTNFDEIYYWLYCVERVGIAAGFKYFGLHNWYKEGAAFLLQKQRPDGSWMQIEPEVRTPIPDWAGGQLPDTCFALLFLYKGRAPVLFNKLRFDGIWNPHRRDVANLTRYIEFAKEQQFHWQIVDLAAPLDELHDAPILFLCAESVPKFTVADRRKLRAFTDSGGTILVEASCGNPQVREWFTRFASEVWSEWPLQPLGPDHAVFVEPYRLPKRPELMGLHDGLRTFLFFSLDDVSCPWQMRALADKEYLFQWGINLFTYATDQAPLRAKLAPPDPPRADRYAEEVRLGPRKTLRIARLRHAGDWDVGANYGALRRLAPDLQTRLGLTLAVREPATIPYNSPAGGAGPEDLAGADAVFLTGTRPLALTDAEKAALKDSVAKGGLLWAEAAGGAPDFDASFRALAAELGWTPRELHKEHPLMTGKFEAAQGHDLTDKVEFRRALRLVRVARPWAELVGLFDGARLVGLYSPFDVLFSATAYEANKLRGYRPADASAVLTNVLVYLTTLGSGAGEGGTLAPPTPSATPARPPAPGPTPAAPPTPPEPARPDAPDKPPEPPKTKPEDLETSPFRALRAAAAPDPE